MNLRLIRSFLIVSACAAFFSGCSSTHSHRTPRSGAGEPLPPGFLTGPAAALLTNLGPFSAHVVISNPFPIAKILSGELFARDGQLLFAAEPGKRDQKKLAGVFTYMSDIRNRQGFVMSEALQGYAPLIPAVGPTHLASHTMEGVIEKVDGHVCQRQEATVEMSDGSQSVFQLLLALDLNRFPIRISSLSNAPAFTISLSKIRNEALPADLFSPPTGFTRYDSPEMMLTELIMRQNNLTRKPTPGSEMIYERKQ
jgi:hypothetical protein